MVYLVNEYHKQLTAFNEDLCQMRNVDGIIHNVPPYLGDNGAEKEWNDDPQKAQQMFLHTKSYHEFAKPYSLILLGRNGTGKTAILRCLYDNVQKKKIKEYDIAVIVPFDEILDNIIKAESNFTETSTINKIKDIIKMHINCYIMKALVNENKLGHQSKMQTYLAESGLLDSDYAPDGINRFMTLLKQAKEATEALPKIYSVFDIADRLFTSKYEEACKEMRGCLKDKTILVLIDTLNEYDLRDTHIISSVKALIAVCFSYYNRVASNNIYIKISLPSEIHTHLIEALPGKQQMNTVVIYWRNNDLIKMIALRLLRYCKEAGTDMFSFANDFDFKDFYGEGAEATEKAKKLIANLLPATCPTSLEYCFDTIAYCIRHTLKKPRELMSIFNTFIHGIMESGNVRMFYDNPNKIRDMIHSTQEGMISQALSMYTTSYKDIIRACEIVLQNRKYYFLGKELDDKLKEAEVQREGYNKDDIKRILLESGLIGKVSDVSYLHMKQADTESTSKDKEALTTMIQIVKAKFEYQVKGRLSLNPRDVYVLHPMCYEHFECTLGMRTLVYPDQFDDDAETMNSVKLKKDA